MVEWLRQQRLRDMKCTVHELKIMDSNLSQFQLGVHSTILKPKTSIAIVSFYLRAHAFGIISHLEESVTVHFF